MQVMQGWAGVAQQTLFKGMAKAREHQYDRKSVESHVTGDEREAALAACSDTEDGKDVLYRLFCQFAASGSILV